MTSTETGQVIAHGDGAVGWITFDHPQRHNAMSMAMWQALSTAVRGFQDDDAIRVIVLRGAGHKAFVSGADISQFEQRRSSPESTRAYDQATGKATDDLAQVGKPTIAMVRGYCIGGGVSIAASCDLRIADESARFGVPAARLGLGYGFAGVRKLVDLIGPAFTKEIFFTARQFSAQEALAMGLVNRVVPGAQLESQVRDCALSIAANAPLTVSSVKTLVAQVLEDESRRDDALCRDVVERCFASADYVEGRTAFMQKRPPVFRGR